MSKNSFTVNEALLRAELLRKLTEGGKDIDGECGYPATITREEYRKLFDREGFATRLVSIFPEECWATPPNVYETEDDEEETEFEKSFKELVKKKKIWHYLKRADILSGVGRFGVVLIGLNDGKKLTDPVDGVPDDGEFPEKVNPRQLLYLKPFDESCVEIAEWEKDAQSPRFGYPKKYNIRVVDHKGESTSVSTLVVHWTRVLHLADERTNSDVFGTPRLQSVYNRIHDIRKVAGGSAEMFWKGGFPGYATEVDADTEIDVDAAQDEILAYQNGLNRWLMLEGIKVKPLDPQVADPSNHLKAIITLAALSKGIPYRIFMGTEEAQLAGSQDAKAWLKRCHSRNLNYVSPLVIEPLITRFIQMGILPAPDEENGFTIDWTDPDNLTEEQLAKVAETLTNAMSKYVAGNVDQFMPPPEYMSLILKMSSEEIKQVLDAAEEYQDVIDERQAEEAEQQAQAQIDAQKAQPQPDGTGSGRSQGRSTGREIRS